MELYRIPQPGDHVYAGKLLFDRMHVRALLYREIAPDNSCRVVRFASAVEAQNYADEHNLEYFGINYMEEVERQARLHYRFPLGRLA